MRRTIIPPRTMRHVSRERNRQNHALPDLQGLAERLKSIEPELTSRLKEAKERIQRGEKPSFDKGFNISIGGSGIGRAAPRESSSSGVSPHQIYKQASKRKPAAAKLNEYTPIECAEETMLDYDGMGNLGIFFNFIGLNFTNGAFSKGMAGGRENASVLYAPVMHENRNVFLILTTIEDIVELEVVPEKRGVGQIFSREFYIPELAGYNPSSMSAARKNGLVIVSYAPRQ